MTDPRDELNPHWPQTIAPFGATPQPPGSPVGTPWEHPLLQALAALVDSSKLPIPPAQPPIFPPFPTSYPSVDKIPAWMVSSAAPTMRRILEQFSQLAAQPAPEPWNRHPDPSMPDAVASPTPPASPPIFPPSSASSDPYQGMPSWLQTAMPGPYSAPPGPSSWDPSSPSSPNSPVAASADFPAPAAIDDDPFTRAARRTRQSVQPQGGRQPGLTTAILQNLLPSTVQGLVTLPQRALEAAGNFHRTGEYDPRPVLETAMLMVGSPLTPKGALGSAVRGVRGAKRPPLPMDEASRMGRAEEMGFRTEMPLYHGTSGSDFRAFDPSKRGSMTQAPHAREGVWSALNPEVAAEFAEMAARKNPDGQRILPLLHRTENPARLRLKGHETHRQIAATLADAFDDGIDAVLVENYTSPARRTKQNILVVKNENQLRSRFAKFDPANRNSTDLSASIAALLGPGVAVYAADEATPQANDDAFWNAWRRGDAL